MTLGTSWGQAEPRWRGPLGGQSGVWCRRSP